MYSRIPAKINFRFRRVQWGKDLMLPWGKDLILPRRERDQRSGVSGQKSEHNAASFGAER